MEPTGSPLMHFHDFELHDYIDNARIDQFVDLIRGEHENSLANFDLDLINNGCLADNLFGPTHAYVLESNAVGGGSEPNSMFNTLPSFDGEMKGGKGVEEDENDGEDSSATATTMTNIMSSKRSKVDRSRTLISERRRRGRMKEKLYALRSLVPNITKMDKASIVGDAVLYVQDLQMQAKKLKSEIAALEASIAGTERYQCSAENPQKIQPSRINQLVPKKIIQMDVFQVEEKGFYVRLVCDKGFGVAMSLYKVLESLTNFNVQSSNLATASETFVLTANINVTDCEQEMNLPNLKLWVTGALLNQGFEI